VTAVTDPPDQPPPRRATHRTPGRWSAEKIRALGVVTDLQTAADILDLPRSTAYDLAHAGQFPVPILRAGSRYRVPTAPLLAALGLTDNQPPTPRRDGPRADGPRGDGPCLDPSPKARVDHPTTNPPARRPPGAPPGNTGGVIP
jgi:hypothetical protein